MDFRGPKLILTWRYKISSTDIKKKKLALIPKELLSKLYKKEIEA